MEDEEDAVYDIIRNHPQGINNEDLLRETGYSARQLQDAINNLLQSNRITMEKISTPAPSGSLSSAPVVQLVFVAVDEEDVALLGELNENERIIYSHIKTAGNRGIWMKELLSRTNLHRATAQKAVKTMEQRNIIKSVKSVKNPSKRILMLYDLVPSVDLTGGSWFTDNELDTEMINAISKVALKFISDKCQVANRQQQQSSKPLLPASSHFSYPTASDILEFINSKGVLMQPLELTDIKELLAMLVDARQLERVDYMDAYRQDPRSISCNNDDATGFGFSGGQFDMADSSTIIGGGGSVYRQQYKAGMYWTEMPCGKCPVFDQCSPLGQRITPSTCEYYTQWLSF